MADIIDLSTLGSAGFIIQGDAANDLAGFSVSGAGDVNGDGFGDVIVGARAGDDGGNGAGEAYVIFGKANGFGTIDLTGLAAPDGFIIQGDINYDQAGRSVSGAGDVNGDGFDDVIIGAPEGDDGGFPRAGEAYVIFGKAGGFTTIDLTSFNPDNPGYDPTDGFTIQGGDSYDQAGWSVSSAGDVNGDGVDDIIVGANEDEVGGNAAGAAYVIFGNAAGFGTVDLTFLAANDGVGFTILGGDPSDRAGWSVSSARDLNGDGFDDVIVGVPGNEDGGAPGAGAAFVVFGKANGFADIDLSSLDLADGFAILGATGFDNAGLSVSSAGDINGDGYDDVIVASPETTNNANDGRTAFVLFGKAGGFADIDLESLAPADGFSISVRAGTTGDVISNVSSAGDVNGDGFDDIIVGEPYGGEEGKAYVIFGNAVLGDVDLANLAQGDGLVIQGDTFGDRAGFSVSAAGDVNDDGFADVIVGAHNGDDGGAQAGEAYVVFGRAPTSGVTRTGSAIDQTISGGDFNDILSGLGGADTLRGFGGDDVLDGGDGDDSLDGGSGTDTARYANAGAGVTLRLVLTTAQDTGGAGVDTLSSIENAIGSGFADTLSGTIGVNRLEGGGGHDSLSGQGGEDLLIGGSGNDVLNGGGGDDQMRGNLGDDIFFVREAGDQAIEGLNQGHDQVKAFNDHTMAANIEDMRLLGTAHVGTGNGLDNMIFGSSIANILSGLGGDDTLRGQSGVDELRGGDDADILYGDLGNDSLFGDAGEDRLNGDDGVDTLDGGVGDDRLFGKAGADILDGGSGDDALNGGIQRDTMTGGADADQFVFADGDTAATRNGADIVTDFNSAEGDRINLRQTDADTGTGGDQNFTFVGDAAFSGAAGELRYGHAQGDTFIEGDTNGDGTADFMIRLDGLVAPVVGDFVL
ncbi:hypothetical protein ACFQRC_06075 [Enterovirga sp. GCM10030262]|uniref:hypothetical protein n=1 Tax=Enterovirga sp. GCM10030262 TaxID=3273391 RepID=UPI00360B8289